MVSLWRECNACDQLLIYDQLLTLLGQPPGLHDVHEIG